MNECRTVHISTLTLAVNALFTAGENSLEVDLLSWSRWDDTRKTKEVMAELGIEPITFT